MQIFTFNGIHAIHKKEHREGQELGEYFGGSLASGEINGDIYDDLLVGAPYFSGKTYNEGRVYIFLGGKASDCFKENLTCSYIIICYREI